MSDIDFNEASQAWRTNILSSTDKKKKPNGTFVYKCCYIRSSGKRCTRTIESSKTTNAYQLQHAWSYEKNNNNEKSRYFCKRHNKRSTYQIVWQE